MVSLKFLCSRLSRDFSIKHTICSHVVNSTNSFPTISSPDFRIVFLGNDNFSMQSLKAVAEIIHSKKCLTVVTSNRNNIVGKYVTANELHHVLWNDFKSAENSDRFHVGVVASFGHLIPKRVIEKCELGILNVHGSLLPKYRGASPVTHAIKNGDSETGISIMKIAPHKFDIGPILARRKVPIHPDIRAPELRGLLANVGSQTLKEVLLNLKYTINHIEKQTDEEATLAPKLSPDMGHVNWEMSSALQVYNLFRSVYGFFKLSTFYKDRKVDLDNMGLVKKTESVNVKETNLLNKVTDSTVTDFTATTDFSKFYPSQVSVAISSSDPIWNNNNFIPGQIVVKNDIVLVKCADENGWIFFQRIKVGTKWMNARDFQNGFVSKTKGIHLFQFSPQINENTSKLK